MMFPHMQPSFTEPSLLITAFAGLKTLGSEGRGPLAGNGLSAIRLAYADSDENNGEHPEQSAKHRLKNQKSEFWEDIHEALTGFMIFLILTHVGGVVVSSWAHKENLILSMITGKKRIK